MLQFAKIIGSKCPILFLSSRNMHYVFRKTGLYSSQRHLVDAEVYSFSDEASISSDNLKLFSNEKSIVSKRKEKAIVENNISSWSQDNASFQHNEDEEKSDKKLLNNSNSHDEDDSSKSFNKIEKAEPIPYISNINDIETDTSQPNSSDHREIKTHKLKRKKKKQQNLGDECSVKSSSPKSISENIELATIKENVNDKSSHNFEIIGIYIHKADTLKIHPLVNACEIVLEIYDYSVGTCLNENTAYRTHYHMQNLENSSVRQVELHWNEFLIFDNALIKSIEQSKKIIMFLKLYNSKQTTEDKDLVAWSFIKPVNESNVNFLNKKIRLQLYEPDNSSDSYKIYNHWKSKMWKIYPSSLHVIVKGYKINKDDEYFNTVQYSSFNNAAKISSTLTKKNFNIDETKALKKRESKDKCKIFNSIYKCLQYGGKSCFIMKFSPCGKHLAYAVKADEFYSIVILKVPNFTQEGKLTKHKNIIYDLFWNTNSTILISASSDCSVCVWENVNGSFMLLQQINQNAFVYSARLSDNPNNVMATGSFDKVVRLWTMDNDKKFHLHQELQGHQGFINAVCFAKKSKMLYSGDSVGLIIKWNHTDGEWHELLKIKCSEIRDHIINDLVIFPNNQRLFIVLRSSTSWILDTSTSTLVACLRGGINYRHQLRGCISPCGNFVVIGNCIWNASTAELLAIYNPVIFNYQAVTAIDYHPCYDVACIVCGFVTSPILICSHENGKLDENLNMDLYKFENENVQEHLLGTTDIASKDLKTAKQVNNILKTTQKDPTDIDYTENQNEVVYSSKLLKLINKMDVVISTVKKEKLKNKEKIKMETNYEQIRNMRLQKDVFNNEDQDELKIDIKSQMSDGTYTVDKDIDDVEYNSTLSEAESIHTYTVSPKHHIE